MEDGLVEFLDIPNGTNISYFSPIKILTFILDPRLCLNKDTCGDFHVKGRIILKTRGSLYR